MKNWRNSKLIPCSHINVNTRKFKISILNQLFFSIGPNIKQLIERPDGVYCFREQKDRVYYVSENILKLANTMPPEHLISVGTCFGKFTKTGKFKLHITALNYLAPYAQVIFFAIRYTGHREI